MPWKLQKKIPILLAILFGIGIIFFSIKGGSFFNSKTSFNADGSPSDNSWLDSLKVIPQNSTSTLSSGARGGFSNSTTTATDIFARYTLTSAMLYQTTSGGTEPISDEDAQAVADNIAKSASDQNPVKQYSRSDIVIVPTSTASFDAYRKELAVALNVFAKENTVSELQVVAKATEAKDPQKLALLDASITSYRKLISSLVAIKTPEVMANIYVLMIQGYALILSGVEDMKQTFSDPARGLNGVTKYSAGVNIITQVNTIFTKMR